MAGMEDGDKTASLKLPSGQTIEEYMKGLDEDVKKEKTCDKKCKKFFPYFNREKHKVCSSKNECELCGFTFTSRGNRNTHFRRKTCFKQMSLKLPSGQTIEEYMEGLDEDVKKEKTCDKDCKKFFPYFNREKHKVCGSKNECKLCGTTFTYSYGRTEHLRRKICSQQFHCQICGKDFSTVEERECHLDDCEPKEAAPITSGDQHLTCETSGKDFTAKKDRECPENETDTTTCIREFISCEECQHEYVPHHSYHHICYAAFECKLCGRGFNKKFQYNRHLSKGNACVIYAGVSNKLPSGQTIEEYMEGLDEDVKKEKTCDKDCKKFFPYFNREKHKVCGSKNECKLCGTTFTYSSGRTGHLRRKICSQQFHCQICGKDFSTVEERECHLDDCEPKEDEASEMNTDVSLKLPSGQTIEEYMEGLDEDVKKEKTCDKKCKKFFPYFIKTKHKCYETPICDLCGSSFGRPYGLERHKKLKLCTPYEHTEANTSNSRKKFVTCQHCKRDYIPNLKNKHRCFAKKKCKHCGRDFANNHVYNKHISKGDACLKYADVSFKIASGQTIEEYMGGLDEDVKKEKTCNKDCKTFFPYFNPEKHECDNENQCHLCGSRFDKRSGRIRHLINKICTNRFYCKKCGMDFLTIEERESHRDDCKEKGTTCPKCFKSFTNFKPWLHMCHAKTMCKLCGKRFLSLYQLRRHKQRKVCNPKFPCRHCGVIFSSRYAHRFHQPFCQHKPPTKALTCKTCKHQYHNDVQHDCKFKITCSDCGRNFHSHLKRFRHIMLDSCNSKKACCGCGKSFISPSGLLGHLKFCDLWKQNCGAKLDGWRTKLVESEDKVSKCPVCWETFQTLELLERHMEDGRCSDKDRPVDKLVCIKCNQKKIKQRMHSCKGFHCRLCEKVFKSKSELNCHRTLKSCLAIQKCDHCGKLFKKGGFEEHVILKLCQKGKKKLTEPSPPDTPVITPPGFCSFCFKRLRQGEVVDHLKKCEHLLTEERPSCPFCACKFSSPLDVFMHTANLKETTCSRRGFPCGHCMFITTSKKVAVAHAKSKHNLSVSFTDVKIDTGFSCFVCNEHFCEKEVNARFHTLTCSETYGMNPLSVILKRCNEEAIESEVPAKRARMEAVVKVEPETENEYVPRLVLVVP